MARIPALAPADSLRTVKQVRILASSNIPASDVNYSVVKVGVAGASGIDYFARFDGNRMALRINTPLMVYGGSQTPVKIPSGKQVVVDVQTVGSASVEGMSVVLRVSHSLTDPGQQVADRSVLSALDGLHGFNRSVGAGEQDIVITLHDTDKVLRGTFHGRLQLDSATQVSLAAYSGAVVEVNGQAVDITTAPTLLSTAKTTNAAGVLSSTALATDTLYYIYLSQTGELRASTTAPTRLAGVYYLGTTGRPALFRFVGWVRTNGSTQFDDSLTAREVVNYYNRVLSKLYTCPGYVDDDSQTTYTETLPAWTAINGGAGATVSFISNGEDAVYLSVTYRAVSDTLTAMHGPAIGIDGVADIETAGDCVQVGAERVHITVPRVYAPATAGRHTATLVSRQSLGITTVYADNARNGATVDPAETFLCGEVMT